MKVKGLFCPLILNLGGILFIMIAFLPQVPIHFQFYPWTKQAVQHVLKHQHCLGLEQKYSVTCLCINYVNYFLFGLNPESNILFKCSHIQSTFSCFVQSSFSQLKLGHIWSCCIMVRLIIMIIMLRIMKSQRLSSFKKLIFTFHQNYGTLSPKKHKRRECQLICMVHFAQFPDLLQVIYHINVHTLYIMKTGQTRNFSKNKT